MMSATCPAVVPTASIPPPAGKSCSNLPSLATSLIPCSMGKTPAMQAAAYSPMLWPMTYAGAMPDDIHNRASAHSRAKKTGLP